jgi:predicted nucleic acid-binding protein
LEIVCDSSVLISLSSIGKLNLLRDIFKKEQIIIPRAVWKEVVEEGGKKKGAQQVKSSKWIHVEDVEDVPLVKLLNTHLDKGESEAIVLALKYHDSLLIIDEKEARDVAQSLNLKFIGTIGVLLKAKQKGYIQSLKTELSLLENKGKFWIAVTLYDKVLKEAKED